MAWACALCGKKSAAGNMISRRGLAKKKGGVGKKTTGICKRVFRPNLQKIRAVVNGKTIRIKVCTGCIKKGLVTKPA
jgi:large subunit ribosomal protein L28